MADGPDQDQKTEAPSGRKLEHARQSGQVPHSREVNTWFMLMAGTVIVVFMSTPIAHVLRRSLIEFIELRNFLGQDGIRWEQVRGALGQCLVMLVVPMLLTIAAAITGTVVQIG